MNRINIAIGLILVIILALSTSIVIFQNKKTQCENSLNNKRVKMIIEGLASNQYDTRISTRSLENALYHSSPAVQNTIRKLLEKNNESPKERYTDELLSDTKKRDTHTKRFNKIVDELNILEPKLNKEIKRYKLILSILRFFEVLFISLAIILNVCLITKSLKKQRR